LEAFITFGSKLHAMNNDDILPLVNISTDDIFKDPNDFLDNTLRQLLLETDISPDPQPREVIFMRKGQRLNTRDMHIVIQKLLKDGYAGSLPDKEWYYITFDGAKLIKDGGYTKASEKAKYQKKIQNLKDYLVIVGAWMAGTGSICLLYFEYVKMNHHYPFGFRFWKIALGISILLLPVLSLFQLQQRLKRK
jgi:hypothetical protein